MNKKNVYFQQLNGIRFIAILLVLVDHWFAESIPYPLGQFGVVIFFVLSGFLISRILFTYKDDLDKRSIFQSFKLFIARRTLRIFPIYFIVCFLGLLWNVTPIREHWGWLFSYTSNLYIIVKNSWIGVWDHFWSLAVEEQFYLFFPFFVFGIPKKYLKQLLIFMIVFGVGVRFYFYFTHTLEFRQEFWYVNNVNTLAALDCFGLGGLLAYSYHYKDFNWKKYMNGTLLFISSLLVMLNLWVNQNLEYSHGNMLFTVFERSIFSVFSLLFIGYAIQDKKNVLNSFLQNGIVFYLGTISYGLYVYHNFIYNIYHNEGNTLYGYLNDKFLIAKYFVFQNQFTLFLCNFIVLVFVSSVSWFFVEKPLNSLKNKFE